LSDYFDLLFLNSGIAIECSNKLDSFNQFEKGAVGFQINRYSKRRYFPRMKRLISSFWALPDNY